MHQQKKELWGEMVCCGLWAINCSHFLLFFFPSFFSLFPQYEYNINTFLQAKEQPQHRIPRPPIPMVITTEPMRVKILSLKQIQLLREVQILSVLPMSWQLQI